VDPNADDAIGRGEQAVKLVGRGDVERPASGLATAASRRGEKDERQAHGLHMVRGSCSDEADFAGLQG